MKRLFAFCLTAIFVLTLFSAFSVSALAGNSTPISISASAANNSVLDNVPNKLKNNKVNMLVWWEADKTDLEKASVFNAATDINVSYTRSYFDKYQVSLSSMIMAGNPPSLAAITNEWFPLPITRGLIQPLYNVKGWDWADDTIYATDLMDQFCCNGVPYGIAVKGSTNNTFHLMYFNKKILEQSGITRDPYQLWKAGQWNWDTCLDIAKKCTKRLPNGAQQYGMSLIEQHYWMLSAGQDFVVTNSENTLTNNIANPALRNAWYTTWDFVWKEGVVDTSFKGSDPFYCNTIAMLGGGSHLMKLGEGYNIPQNMRNDWGVAPFPSPKGQDTIAITDATVWGFPATVSGDALQSAAWYLRYYLDDHNNPKIMDSIYDPYHPECWEIMNWLWEQPIQSYNSVGTLTYDGNHTAYTLQYSLIDETRNDKSKITATLDTWNTLLNNLYIPKIQCQINDLNASAGKNCWKGNHPYTSGCDNSCNECGHTRTVSGHTYDNATDKTCNICGAIRNINVQITSQPTGAQVKNGATAKVTVGATGAGLTYTWYIKNKGASKYSKSSIKTNTYSVKMSSASRDRYVYCVVKDKYGNSVKSDTVVLRMVASITKEPTTGFAKRNAAAKVSFTAAGDGLKYQWYVKNPGTAEYVKSSVKTATYSAKMTEANSGRLVYCIITDKYGKTAQTKTVVMRMQATITTQPKSTTVKKNTTAKVTVKAVGDGLKYQWYVKTAGASKYAKSSNKTATYSVKMTASAKNRQVYCIVTDKYGKKVQTSTVSIKKK